jgi:geranylgeranyl diphosphate synthase type II
MYTLKDCQNVINTELEGIFLNEEPGGLYEPVRYILSMGGKRLRPSLTLMGCNLFTDEINIAIYPAIAIELFHNFTLMHDDVMDRSEIRRSRPTVHKKWNENAAILSGDVLLVKSYEYLSKCQENIFKGALEVFTETAIKVCEGQQYDMEYEIRSDVSIGEYLKMIELKTATLIAGALRIGALAGQASSYSADLLYEFGRYIGIAFQLQDDLLDVYADPEVFGKSGGGDIVSNKKTFLLISALNSKNTGLVNIVKEWMGKAKFDKGKKIREITRIFDELNLRELTSEKIDYYFDMGLEFLDKLPVPGSRKSELRKVVSKLLDREK